MHWSTTETKRVAVCLFLSVLLHLAVVLLTPTMPDSQPGPSSGFSSAAAHTGNEGL